MSKTSNSEFRTVQGYQKINQRSGQLTPALEDYLEMVYRCCGTNDYARVGKIAELLNVTASSASKMVSKLTNLGYLKYERHEIIFLTAKGREAGSFLLDRHNRVDQFLHLIGIADSLEITELLEHSLNKATVEHLITLLDFFDQDAAVMKNYEEYRKEHRCTMSHA